ncbi:MAG: hypothetical protein ACXVPR_08115 [Actinomycetota bacterium]
MTTDVDTIARRYVEALADKDEVVLRDLFAHDVDFRGLTPSREWRATDQDGVVGIVLGSWFEPTDHVREISEISSEPIADRHRLRYRLRVENDDGMHVVEQQAYVDVADGRITRASFVCSGYRPVGATPQS